MEYDWRTRFHKGLNIVGDDMSLAEASRLVVILREDPSSMTAAALAGWSYPMTREALVLMDLYDLQHMSKAKKRPDPYPRPWAALGTTTRRGDAAGRTPEQVKAILREQFGQPARPTDSEV